MKRIAAIATVAAVLGMSAAALAQSTPPKKTGPGQSEFAPGQQSGPAKKFAPGQKMQQKDDPNSPGATEYAPGQQGKTTPPPNPGSTKKK